MRELLAPCEGVDLHKRSSEGSHAARHLYLQQPRPNEVQFAAWLALQHQRQLYARLAGAILLSMRLLVAIGIGTSARAGSGLHWARTFFMRGTVPLKAGRKLDTYRIKLSSYAVHAVMCKIPAGVCSPLPTMRTSAIRCLCTRLHRDRRQCPTRCISLLGALQRM